MKEIKKEEFKKELMYAKMADNKFHVDSVDYGSVQLHMFGCYVVSSQDGYYNKR